MAQKWRPADALVKLREQLNAAHPNRSKASDGMIGDEAHAADATSDHNPNAAGVVTAFDITHDPANGVDIDTLSDALQASRDPRIKYIIANGLILVPNDFGWDQWVDYYGLDPHTNHLHLSVWNDYDSTKEWSIGSNMKLTKVMVNLIWMGFFDKEAPANELKYWVGREDTKEFEAYLMSLYRQNETRRWQANNYDKQIATARAEGITRATALAYINTNLK